MEKDTKDNNQVVVFIDDGLELNINFDYLNRVFKKQTGGLRQQA